MQRVIALYFAVLWTPILVRNVLQAFCTLKGPQNAKNLGLKSRDHSSFSATLRIANQTPLVLLFIRLDLVPLIVHHTV